MNDQTSFLIEERIKTIRERLICKGMTYATIKTYCSALKCLFNHLEKTTNISEEEILIYLDYLILKKKYSERSRNLIAKIIRFYFREFLDIELTIKKSKEDKPIPRVCWDNQLKQILEVTPYIKHKLVLLLMRYSGLRNWEIIRLKKHHILDDGTILVKHGKGRKDRYTICHKNILDKLRKFISLLPTNNNNYIFQGQKGIGHYSSRTPLAILHNAFKSLKWHKDKWFGCHALRHAFCIYSLDDKIGDYDQVSKWLGHSVGQTSQIYTQCRRINHIESIKKYDAIECVIP